MDRNAGKGPFSVPKEVLPLPAADRQGGPLLPVIDAAGETFCYVGLMDCHGRDLPAAKARATRIAEALNKADALYAAEEDLVLPCSVHVPPATTIVAGCKLSTLMEALHLRGMKVDGRG